MVMLRAAWFVLFLAIVTPTVAATQNWGNLDALIMAQLTEGQALEGSTFMPDAADPAQATRAVAVAYTHIPGSAGNVGIHVGFFQIRAGTWFLARRIEGLYGMGVEAPEFGPNHFEVTTNMLGPQDARCCPTLKVRWRIDLATGAVRRLS